MGLREHPEWRGVTRSDIGAPKVPLSAKMTKTPLMGPKTVILIWLTEWGWNQCHWEDNQILIPKTIHGSKSELEGPRYHENRDNAPIDAPLTSENHNFWSNRWIFKFHTFSKSGSQYLSNHVKINPIRRRWGWRPYKGRRLEKLVGAINSSRHPPDQKKDFWEVSLGSALCLDDFHSLFLSSKQKKLKKKTHQSLLILASSPKIQGSVLVYNLFFLGSTPWIWSLGVWM